MKAVFSIKYVDQRKKMKAFCIKSVFMLMVLFAGLMALADVPPPRKTIADTAYKTSEVKSMNAPYSQPVEMATGMRSSGKIYVVVAVLSMILIGLFIYLFTLDRKISRLEKDQ